MAIGHAICLDNTGFPVSLERHKVYTTLPDRSAQRHGMLRVVDESDEDYLYPAFMFFAVRLPIDLLARRKPTTPGEALREDWLKPWRMSQRAFATKSGLPLQALRDLFNERVAVTRETARLLGKATKTTAQSWMDLQRSVDRYHARKKLIAAARKARASEVRRAKAPSNSEASVRCRGVCPMCGIDPNLMREVNGMVIGGHDCHCVREKGVRVAVGICCGHMLGEALLIEEDAADARRARRSARPDA